MLVVRNRLRRFTLLAPREMPDYGDKARERGRFGAIFLRSPSASRPNAPAGSPMDDDETRKIYEEVDNRELELDDELPLLPIRNHVLFPGSVAPFDVGREKSVALVEDLEGESQPTIVIFAQKDPATDDPRFDDLFSVGVAARVLKALRHSTGNYSLILQGLVRVRL
ncbi:MAG TPA: LON peptidase substrate-binding domain-containing protein, partial [Polyangiales bacterium]|nr:LON peptidase substrate-binding domain-containing protein [Polyangiales bacterium]